MNDPYHELADALRERLAVIGNRQLYAENAAAHLEQLKEVTAKIGTVRRQLPVPVDPQLQHYLDRCSFDKALACLEQRGSSETSGAK